MERRRIQASRDLRLLRLINVGQAGNDAAFKELQQELIDDATED